MSGWRDCLARAAFTVTVLSLLLPIWPIAGLGRCLVRCAPSCQACVSNIVIRLVVLAWRTSLCLCCWISLEVEGLQDFRNDFGASELPTILLANHISFLDIILVTSLLPLRQCGRVRMLVANNVMRLPIIGTICRAVGHLEVPFKDQKTSTTSSMSVETDVMEERMRKFEEYVSEGCIAGWFPEGRMNLGDTSKVQLFRAGGFRLPAREDVEMWCLAFLGNSVCWPPRAQFGGSPARIGCKIFRLCESSFDLLADAPAPAADGIIGGGGNVAAPNGDASESILRERMLYVANYAHGKVQAAVDELIAEGYSGETPNWALEVDSDQEESTDDDHDSNELIDSSR